MKRLAVALYLAGLVVFGYIGWTVWGSDLWVAQKQEMTVDRVRVESLQTASSGTSTPGSVPQFEIGDTVGVVEIPKIDVTRPVIEGVGDEELKNGVGRLETSSPPSHVGNLVLAGHRVTYGRPFHNVDQLVEGDEIVVEIRGVKYTYHVTGSKIVGPEDLSVLESTEESTITLVACHPKFSAAERYIVFGELSESVDLV